MTRHLDEGVLHALLDGEVGSTELPAIKVHLESCADCRARLDEARAFHDEADRLVGEIELPAIVESLPGTTLAVTSSPARPPRRIQLRPLAYAATLLVALGLGYGMRGWVSAPGANIVAGPARDSLLAAAPPAPSQSSLADLVSAETDSVAPPAEPVALAANEGGPAPESRTARRDDAAARAPKEAPVELEAGADSAARGARDVGGAAPATPAVPAPALAQSRLAEERQAAPVHRRFEGKVTDESGRGIAGAVVQVQGTGLQALTRLDGGYSIRGEIPETSQVRARAIGHRPESKRVSISDSAAARVDFTLPLEQYRLEEVVVSGANTPSRSALRSPIVLRSADRSAFQAIDFPEALRRLGGRIRLVDGLVPSRLEASGDTVRVAYQVGRGRAIVWLQQFRAGDTVAFALIPPPGFPADSLARLTARVKP